MECIRQDQLSELFQGVADIFAEKMDELCAMDAAMGDGDLGITMKKGFAALPKLISECHEENNIGKTLMKTGMKMASTVPSTMGTLMASGIMEGGKAVGAASVIGPKELCAFLTGFAAGIQKRGKCNPGDRTVYDAVSEAAKKAEQVYNENISMKDIMEAAVLGAYQGVEATKNMKPKFGKAAVFSDKAIGVADQGAVAGKYLMEGLLRFFNK